MQLRLDDEPVPLDNPRLADGWHAPEKGWRWTDRPVVLDEAGAGEVEMRFATMRLPVTMPGA